MSKCESCNRLQEELYYLRKNYEDLYNCADDTLIDINISIKTLRLKLGKEEKK